MVTRNPLYEPTNFGAEYDFLYRRAQREAALQQGRYERNEQEAEYQRPIELRQWMPVNNNYRDFMYTTEPFNAVTQHYTRRMQAIYREHGVLHRNYWQHEEVALTEVINCYTLWNSLLLTEETIMTETIEVKLTEGIFKNIICSISNLKQELIKDLEVNTAQLARHQGVVDNKKSSGADKLNSSEIISFWEKRSKSRENILKNFDVLSKKFEIAPRPIRLSKTDRKILAAIVDKIELDFNAFDSNSGIKNINHPDRFFMFPHLEKKIKGQIAEVMENLKNLTRSDVNVYVK